MTREKDFKKTVRSRMAKTGESYTSARAQVRRPARQQAARPPRYSFANLTGDAVEALARAETIARSAGGRSIETRHLVAALSIRLPTRRLDRSVAVEEAMAAAADVAEDPVEGSSVEGPLPSAQLRASLQHAFAAARERGEKRVHAMHLLMGVCRVPESAGAQALQALRPDAAAIISSWPAGRPEDWTVHKAAPDYSPELIDLLSRALERARRGGLSEVTIEDVLAELGETRPL